MVGKVMGDNCPGTFCKKAWQAFAHGRLGPHSLNLCKEVEFTLTLNEQNTHPARTVGKGLNCLSLNFYLCEQRPNCVAHLGQVLEETHKTRSSSKKLAIVFSTIYLGYEFLLSFLPFRLSLLFSATPLPGRIEHRVRTP